MSPLSFLCFLCLLFALANSKHTFMCENIQTVTNADGTTGQRCSGWVRLTSSQSTTTTRTRTIGSQNRRTSTTKKPSTTTTTTVKPNNNGGSILKPNLDGLISPQKPGGSNKPMIQPVYIIDVPINCPENTRPDAKGICREYW